MYWKYSQNLVPGAVEFVLYHIVRFACPPVPPVPFKHAFASTAVTFH